MQIENCDETVRVEQVHVVHDRVDVVGARVGGVDAVDCEPSFAHGFRDDKQKSNQRRTFLRLASLSTERSSARTGPRGNDWQIATHLKPRGLFECDREIERSAPF